jgi:hypothetical protein
MILRGCSPLIAIKVILLGEASTRGMWQGA